jgi:hypothetical protein
VSDDFSTEGVKVFQSCSLQDFKVSKLSNITAIRFQGVTHWNESARFAAAALPVDTR